MENKVTLYSTIPIIGWWLFPPINFIGWTISFFYTLLVIWFSFKILKVDDIKHKTKLMIFHSWAMSLIADLVATLLMAAADGMEFSGIMYGHDRWWWEKNFAYGILMNPFISVYSFLWVLMCVCVSALLIFWFNYARCVNTLEMSKKKSLQFALMIAVLTAPYIFFVISEE